MPRAAFEELGNESLKSIENNKKLFFLLWLVPHIMSEGARNN